MEDLLKDENLSNNIKQEATQSFFKSEEEDAYQLKTNDAKEDVLKII